MPEISQRFVDINNGSKDKLKNILVNNIDQKYDNLEYHEMVTKIPQIRKIITTNYDRLFEQVYENDKLHVISSPLSFPMSTNHNNVKIYKIHGDIKNPKNLIITKDDYQSFYSDYKSNSLVWDKIRTIVAESPILFIGYNLADPHVFNMVEKTLEILGENMKESYLAIPDLERYMQKKYEKLNIRYINMKTKDLIPIIYNSVRENIVIDTKKKYIDASVTAEVLAKDGINLDFNVKSDNIRVNRISSNDNANMKIDLRINFKGNIDKEEKFKKIFEDKILDSITISSDEINKLEPNFKGIKVPFFDENDDYKLTINSVPKKLFVDLRLENSEKELDEIVLKYYVSKTQRRLIYDIYGFKLEIFYDHKQEKTNLTIKPIYIENVLKGKRVYNFLNEWIDGDSIKVISNEDIDLIIPNFKKYAASEDKYKEIKKVLNSYSKFYNDLYQIQKYFNKKLQVPEKIEKSDIEKLREILFFMNEKTKLLPEFNTEIVIEDKKSFLQSIKNSTNTTWKLSENVNNEISLFNQSFTLGERVIYIENGYIVNLQQIVSLLDKNIYEVPFKLKSHSDEIKLIYE